MTETDEVNEIKVLPDFHRCSEEEHPKGEELYLVREENSRKRANENRHQNIPAIWADKSVANEQRDDDYRCKNYGKCCCVP